MLNFTKEYVHQTSGNAAKNWTSPFNMNFRLQIFLSKVQEIEEENNLVLVLIGVIRYKVIKLSHSPQFLLLTHCLNGDNTDDVESLAAATNAALSGPEP